MQTGRRVQHGPSSVLGLVSSEDRPPEPSCIHDMSITKASFRTPPSAPDLDRSRVARYLQLATLFRNKIASRQWPVGGRIPNVDALALEFAVARGTIREALGVLEQEGLLDRFRAKGTFVRASPLRGSAYKVAIDWNSIIAVHEGVEIKVLESRTLTELPSADLIQGEPAAKYQMMRRLLSRQGRPLLIARFYLDYELFKLGPPAQFRREPTLPILQKVAGARIGKARQTLTIGMADVEMAALLQIPLNAPVAHVHRVALDHGGTIVYVGEGIYRGDAIRLEIELR
jgi:GntR family transcriptional regulator